MKKVSKHPMKKSELEKLKPLIQQKLILKGLSNQAMREIANELGIDAGLVVKVKQRTDSNLFRKNNSAPISEPSILDITNTIPVPEIVSTPTSETEIKIEEFAKEKMNKLNEEKQFQLAAMINNTIMSGKHYLTDKEKDNLIKDYLTGNYKQNQLAEKYLVCNTTVGNILKSRGITTKKGSGDMGKKKGKMTTTRSRNQKPQPKPTPTKTASNEKSEPRTIVKFVTDIPVYEEELVTKGNIIWACSKNRSISDLREDLVIYNIDETEKINSLRDKYYLISFSNNKMGLIDYYDIVNKKIVSYAYHKDTYILYKNEDGIITNEQIHEGIKSIIKYDKEVERSRLKLNNFTFDPKNFTDLQKVFGFDNFSFSLASKNNSITVEAGLVADRHTMPVEKFIYSEALDQQLMFNYPEQERIAKDFLRMNFDFDPNGDDSKKVKVLKLYITGMQCAYGAVMKSCMEMGVNLIAMHYNNTSGSYVPQYIVGDPEETGAYIKGFERILNQKSLNGEILLFNCTYEDFSETNVNGFYIMEAAKMRNTNSSDNQKEESIIVIIKNKEDIWTIYPTVLDHIMANDGLNLALWVTTAKIKDNTFQWGMNVVKSFNYK